MQTFLEFLRTEATVMPTYNTMMQHRQFSQARTNIPIMRPPAAPAPHPMVAPPAAQQHQFSHARTMPTYQELLKQRMAAGIKEDEFEEGILDFMKKKSAAEKTGFKPMKKGPKDSPHYRTDHHYNNGDIEPSSVPVFKPSWQNKH